MDLHCFTAGVNVGDLTRMRNLPEAGLPPLLPSVVSPRSAAGSSRRRLDHLHRLEGSARPRLTNGLGLDQTT